MPGRARKIIICIIIWNSLFGGKTQKGGCEFTKRKTEITYNINTG